MTPVVDKLVSACKFTDKKSRQEAIRVIAFLSEFVDLKLIDEEIGYKRKTIPNLPRYFLKPIREKAQRKGIPIPLMDLEGST